MSEASRGGGEAPQTSLWMRRAGGPQVLALLAITNLVAYAVRNSLFGVYPELRARFAVSDDELGLLTSVFLLPHAIATLPFGWAGDRFNRRRVIAAGMVLSAVASVLGGFSTTLLGLGVARAFVGLGTAAVVPVATSILGEIYDGPRKASRISIFNLGMLFGGLVGYGAGVFFGFPGVLISLSVPTLALGLIVLALPVPSRRASNDRTSASRYARRVWRLFVLEGRQLLAIRTLRWLVLSATAMAFAAGGFNAWLLDFLQRDKHMTRTDATTLISVAAIGAIAGIVVGGRLADRMRQRHVAGRLWTIVLGMGSAVPCTILCILLDVGPLYWTLGTANFFFFSWYHAPIAASIDDVAPPSLAVAAQGMVIFTMHLIGTASSSYVVGLVSEYTSLYVAMWVPACALVVAALAMVIATGSFASDHLRARSGGGEVRVG